MLNKIFLSFLLNAFLERFFNAWGIAFHTFTPIREKKFAWTDSLEGLVQKLLEAEERVL